MKMICGNNDLALGGRNTGNVYSYPKALPWAGLGRAFSPFRNVMKTIKQLFFIILLSVSYNTVIMSQNLDSMPTAERDSLLISIAKEVVLKYGPDYYRECKPPVINRKIFPPKGEYNTKGVNAERAYYEVIFLYDETVELLKWDFATEVRIWADTGKPEGVMFGCGWGRGIPEDELRSSEEIEPFQYRQRSVRPIYDFDDPNPNKRPVNLDELRRKGYVEDSNGQWIKTTQDAPPAEALKVIERAKAEMRKEIDNR